ncbi:TIGR03364 family FAD-dependent oxidoreductase [Algoriphagus sp. CAU 1675]|uniref:TIGR03364 family FAD-dependent oxidoreductase n=1 Tax=Algoriphagus sp. CAU 1675 TaxID=3032597 RepID=UPI0023DA0326|nr:TIGR03364 family FAD-dependent oxidoreductase [Algoriphagus sp. CAU 1675]MDF2157254.1 TIGR03364 family FAD-dependent oxidoreductase [Algoriphagus sp. CAU 1675]
MNTSQKAIVIGAGIVGLALTRALQAKGWQVTVIERHPQAQGASVRNFGMVWPIGQAQGPTFMRAMRSREIWLELSQKAGFFAEQTGSLHLVYSDLERQVAKEYVGAMTGIKSAQWLDAEEVGEKSPAAVLEGLKGGVWSADEVIVDPREAIYKTASYLEDLEGVEFIWNRAISRIEGNKVYSGMKSWSADRIFVASGADFETLYPELFEASPITKCKLQMIRLVRQPEAWRIGPPLCAGLSFTHYKGFEVAPSLQILKEHYKKEFPELVEMGVHVMVSQNGLGELTVGDSHEYGLNLSPFDQSHVNELILEYLKKFAQFRDWKIDSTWNGIYPKMTNGATEFVHQLDEYVTIVNGLGGAGMTLSFGLGEEVVDQLEKV